MRISDWSSDVCSSDLRASQVSVVGLRRFLAPTSFPAEALTTSSTALASESSARGPPPNSTAKLLSPAASTESASWVAIARPVAGKSGKLLAKRSGEEKGHFWPGRTGARKRAVTGKSVSGCVKTGGLGFIQK